jgi:eukaryotic-like serine/threonine-protein kinase
VRHVRAGRLRLIDQIGEGGTGTVWRGWDARRRTFVAVKVLAPGSADGESVGIVHPHIVVPRGTTTGETAVIVVMDLVRGGTADQLLAEHGALPEDYVAVLLEQLLQGLDAVHTAGLVHRDVKPANLLLESTGRDRPHLRLGDFGVAVGVEGPPLTVAGTDAYLAPELAGGADPDPRQDLYAAGITAVELLTGRVPRSTRELPRGRLRRLLTDLCDPDPDRRPPSASAALDRLRAYGVPEGAPWAARPHPPVVPDRYGDLRSPVHPTTWVVLAGFVCAVVLCALLVLG